MDVFNYLIFFVLTGKLDDLLAYVETAHTRVEVKWKDLFWNNKFSG